jgi:hypothetical protein
VGLAVGLALLGRMALQVAVLPLVLVALAVEQRLLKVATELMPLVALRALLAALPAAAGPLAVVLAMSPSSMAAQVRLA